jgi:hypothetical protein
MHTTGTRAGRELARAFMRAIKRRNAAPAGSPEWDDADGHARRLLATYEATTTAVQ